MGQKTALSKEYEQVLLKFDLASLNIIGVSPHRYVSFNSAPNAICYLQRV